MRRALPVVLGVLALAALASASELRAGMTLRSPNTGHEYLIEEEVEYSPRLQALRLAGEQPADQQSTKVFADRMRFRRARANQQQHALNPENWEKNELIGRGGFGAIFKARRKGAKPTDPPVALKQTIIESDAEAPAVRTELAVQIKLQKLCPGLVVEAYDSWEDAPEVAGGRRTFNIVMELMASDLHRYIGKRRSKMQGGDLPSALRLWTPMLRSVQCLHHNGYVHRDLKGGNWLIGEDERTVKAADFGETRDKSQITHTGARLMPHQTIIYNAPTAVRILRNAAHPRGVPVFNPSRTWDQYVSWDGYATGLTMLEVFWAKEVDVIATSSSEPKVAHNDLMGLLQVFTTAFKTRQSYDKFMAALTKAWEYAPLPAEVDALVRGLLLEEHDHGVDTISTNSALFTRSWIRTHDAWVGSETPVVTTASGTSEPAAASPSAASTAVPTAESAEAHHGSGI